MIYRHEKVVGKHFGSVDPIEGTNPPRRTNYTPQSTHKDFLFEIEEVGIKN
ncbi:hypothetical protein ACVQ9Z_03150 [Staphylococcus aureus]